MASQDRINAVLATIVLVLLTGSGFVALESSNPVLRHWGIITILVLNFAGFLYCTIALATRRVPAVIAARMRPVIHTVALTIAVAITLYLAWLILALMGLSFFPMTFEAAVNWVTNTLLGLLLGYSLMWGAAVYFRI